MKLIITGNRGGAGEIPDEKASMEFYPATEQFYA